MMNNQEPLYGELRVLIEEELAAQVGARRLENPDGVEVTADLITHAVWRVFEVRQRPELLPPKRARRR
jgi:hypothetical protein